MVFSTGHWVESTKTTKTRPSPTLEKAVTSAEMKTKKQKTKVLSNEHTKENLTEKATEVSTNDIDDIFKKKVVKETVVDVPVVTKPRKRKQVSNDDDGFFDTRGLKPKRKKRHTLLNT